MTMNKLHKESCPSSRQVSLQITSSSGSRVAATIFFTALRRNTLFKYFARLYAEILYLTLKTQDSEDKCLWMNGYSLINAYSRSLSIASIPYTSSGRLRDF